MPIASLSSIEKTFGQRILFDQLELGIDRGERVGLIGPNGAGKSTLLKMLNGLVKPDAGRIAIRGRMGALIELGAGFHPVLTGRENIYVNGAVLGLAKREIRRRLDEIVDFAEIEDAIDAPVRTYSSGMRVRLGFAIAANLNPDVMLIDEVLAVGDLSFRMKCRKRIAEIRRGGTALVVVSHSNQLLSAICTRGLYVEGGRQIAEGEISDVMVEYERRVRPVSEDRGTMTAELRDAPRPPSESNGVDLLRVEVLGKAGKHPASIQTGAPARIKVHCYAHRHLSVVEPAIFLRELRVDGPYTVRINSSDQTGPRWMALRAGYHELEAFLPYCALRPGQYDAKVLLSADDGELFDVMDWGRVAIPVVAEEPMLDSVFFQPVQWRLEPERQVA
jgi:lipopolysaccharide transport system ATP-binding protein